MGIDAFTLYDNSPIVIENSAKISITTYGGDAFGIYATTRGYDSPITIHNSGDIIVQSTASYGAAYGIAAQAIDGDIEINNSGDVTATSQEYYQRAIGISAQTFYGNISIINSGAATSSYYAIATHSIYGDTHIENSGALKAGVDGIYATTGYGNIDIINTGDITANVHGIHAYAGCGLSGPGCYGQGDVSITNTAKIDAGEIGILAGSAFGNINIQNSGNVTAGYASIFAFTAYDNSKITISNAAKITSGFIGIFAATGFYDYSCGCSTIPDLAQSYYGANSPVSIINTGEIDPAVGIAAITLGANSAISVENKGAVDAYGGATAIYNAGHITGFVALTNSDDIFINQKGGVFETKLTSYFGGGNDLFRNEEGGVVLAATDPKVKETSGFEGLERFENKGRISLQDDAVGDVFFISNSYGATPEFVGSGKSELEVDAFLGGPGSTADNLIINGNVSGKTKVDVNDTNAGPGVFNKEGIPVVYVNGPKVQGNEFFLSQPIDTGFFNYDLFFRPTGSGIFELKSFLGQGAFVLPQLITAAQDMWHSGSSTWFDRTADLRVLLNGGAPPLENPDAKYAEGSSNPQTFTPAVWARGAGNWLNRDDSESVDAYGRTYRYNLNRDLETIDFQSGIDLGKRGLLSDNDILVFGALGGFVHSDLDYDAINRIFSFNGGQVGGYATYLRGGLFVDTLVNVHLLQVDTSTLGFPNSMNATTVGVRTDSGYRFGSFHGGAFIEPLATISATWADINGFSLGGNKVSFNDDAAVQGRLGLRVGTTTMLWPGITAEPFVIGSVWGNLSNDNQATLVSTGTTFHFEDNVQDVWGEVSGGVNFFNPTANTSVFAKVDVTFGQDLDGVGGKAGMRVSW